jgi:hypothetical protein
MSGTVLDVVCGELFNIMVSFSDGVASHTHDNAIRYLLTFWFFSASSVLLIKRIINNGPSFETSLFLIGSLFGIFRNGFMFILDYGYYRGLFPYPQLMETTPLVDHTFQMLSLLGINYAILHLARVKKFLIQYYHFSFILPFIIYCVLAWMKPTGFTETSFNYGELMYHGILFTMSISVLLCLFVRKKSTSISLVCFILFMLTSQVYAIANGLTNYIYSDILTPYHNAYYLWSIPFIIYFIQTIPIKTVHLLEEVA